MVSKYNKKTSGSILLSRNKGIKRKFDAPKTPAALSSKAGRNVIRTHHTLQKQLAVALQNNDTEAAQTIQGKIDASGGLEKYQQASIQGQSDKRGGDSSKILMEWIREAQKAAEVPAAPVDVDDDDAAEEAPPASSKLPAATATATSAKSPTPKMRLLEVGCLSARNAISKSSIFKVTRIDLNAQEAAIESQDFMERPLPSSEDEKFDVISLSLVLNFVPEPAGRGEMLRRTTKFLRDRTAVDPTNPLSKLLPSVFLVLPAPCLANSRHLNEKRLADIMRCIGYTLVKRKLSTKLIYGLWRLDNTGIPYPSGILAKKAEVNPGVTRNNFAILLK